MATVKEVQVPHSDFAVAVQAANELWSDQALHGARTVLVVDMSPVCYAAYNSTGHLKSSTGEPTGMIYGVMRLINSIRKKFKATEVVCVYDSPGEVVKAEGLEEYKSDRVFTPAKQDMYAQIPRLRDVVLATRWSQLSAPGYEADDLIGGLVEVLATSEEGAKVIVYTPDRDMWQLTCHPGVVVAWKRRGEYRIITPVEVVEEFGVSPEHLLVYRALVGDTSDNLNGLPWAKTTSMRTLVADAIMKDDVFDEEDPDHEKSWSAISEWAQMFGGTWGMDDAIQWKKTFMANMQVMALVFPKNVSLTKGMGDVEMLTTMFESLEFKSLLKGAVNEYAG
jgi:hypothetical protein